MSGTSVARASAWMALGTIVSRATGLLRLVMLFWAIGRVLNADIFNNANTIPNMLYILVAGGIFNVVLVPQLVRATRNDADGGEAYAQRVVTLGIIVLGVATVVLVALTPVLMRITFSSEFFSDRLAHQQHSAELLMRLCLPQVFFYGVFVLAGQILNARGRTGPMMWAPIVNNVVACATLVVYVVVYGSSNDGDGFSRGESYLLGVGSTLGIVLQAAVLVPFLRSAGFTFRWRRDLRGFGLGHTIRLGAWTLLYVVVNQVAFVVVNRLGTGSTSGSQLHGGDATGSAVYELGFLVSQMPHGIITVSIATALMPGLALLAAEGRLPRMRLEIARTSRVVLTIIVPIAVAIACLGPEAITTVLSLGAVSGDAGPIGLTLQSFAPTVVLFPLQYLVLRGFYATEDTRTPFFIQSLIAATNVVSAVVLVHVVDRTHVAAALAVSYGIAYLVGAIVSSTVLSRRIGRLWDARMVRFAVRITVAAVACAVVMVAVALGVGQVVDRDSFGGALLVLVLGSLAGGLAYLAATQAMHLEEMRYLRRTLLRRG